MEEFRDDLKAKEAELQTLEDAGTDLMMLEDDEELVSWLRGLID